MLISDPSLKDLLKRSFAFKFCIHCIFTNTVCECVGGGVGGEITFPFH